METGEIVEGIIDEYTAGHGAWERVGKHMVFKESLVLLADDYLRYAFAIPKAEPIPPVRPFAQIAPPTMDLTDT